MNNKFRWCFIGAGDLGQNVARQILASGRHEIVSVYTRRYEAACAFGAETGATPYEDPKAAITAPGVDGVYVVTPHNSHYEYVKLALELGKPVLCEKSFTVDAKEAKELFELASEKKLYLTEAMWSWFAPVANQVKSWLDDGTFGELQKVYINYHMNVCNWTTRLQDPMRAGGAMLDCGVYPITYAYRFFGKPEQILCTGTVEKGIDWDEEIDLTMADGKIHHISISFHDDDNGEVIELVGDKASLRLDDFHGTNQAELKYADGTSVLFEGDGSMVNEFDKVAQEIRAGKLVSDYVPPQATIEIMEIMDECRRQIGLKYPFEA